MGHSHDRAGDWVYHCLLLLGPHSVRWQRWQGIGIHAAADKLFTKRWHCGSRRISLNCRSYRTSPTELPERPFNHTQTVSDFVLGAPKKDSDPTFEDLNPRTLFREFA